MLLFARYSSVMGCIIVVAIVAVVVAAVVVVAICVFTALVRDLFMLSFKPFILISVHV